MSLSKISLLLLSIFSSFNFAGDGGSDDENMKAAIALSLGQPVPSRPAEMLVSLPLSSPTPGKKHATTPPLLQNPDKLIKPNTKICKKRPTSVEENNGSSVSEDESDLSDTNSDILAELKFLADDPLITKIEPESFDDFFASEDRNNTELLQKLLAKYNNVNQLDCNGINLLGACFLYNEDELPLATVEILLQRGVDPYHEYKTGGKDKTGKEEKRSFFTNVTCNKTLSNRTETLTLIEKHFPGSLSSQQPPVFVLSSTPTALAAPAPKQWPTFCSLQEETLPATALSLEDFLIDEKPLSHFCVPLLPGPNNKQYIIESCNFVMQRNSQIHDGGAREFLTYEECAAAITCCGESKEEIAWLSKLLQLHANPKEIDPHYEKTLLFALFTDTKETPLSLKKLKILLKAGVSPVRKSISNESFMDRLNNPLDQLSIPNAQDALRICNKYLQRDSFTF